MNSIHDFGRWSLCLPGTISLTRSMMIRGVFSSIWEKIMSRIPQSMVYIVNRREYFKWRSESLNCHHSECHCTRGEDVCLVQLKLLVSRMFSRYLQLRESLSSKYHSDDRSRMVSKCMESNEEHRRSIRPGERSRRELPWSTVIFRIIIA